MFNLSEIKQIPIDRILSDNGYKCAQCRRGYTMYHSPLRDDKHPSFAVDTCRNRWHDFALGTDGSNIDLIIRLGLADDCGGAARYLKKYLDTTLWQGIYSGNSDKLRAIHDKTERAVMTVTSVTPLRSPALRRYITEVRGIPAGVAEKYLNEVHCRLPSGRSIYGAGMKNRSGGYAVRNPYFKMAVPPIDITLLPAISNQCCDECMLFEGMLSFLSLVAMQGTPRSDVIILNSVTNTLRAADTLSQYYKIHCYLDNDSAGGMALETIRATFPNSEVVDESLAYAEYNDLNNKLINIKNDKH